MCARNLFKSHGVTWGSQRHDFGWFWKGNVVDFLQVKSTMDKNMYHGILKYHVVPSGTRNIGREHTFQKDNDQNHISKFCLNYLKTKAK